MGKRRLRCPGCGKTLAVSEKAKKARCPGCREVIDVDAALEGAGPSPEAASAAEKESAAAEKEPAVGPAAPEEAPPESQAAAEGAAVPAKKKDKAVARRGARRVSRRGKPGREALPEEKVKAPDRPPVTMAGPLNAWMAVLIVSVAVAVLLWLFLLVEWYAAIVIACALGLYVDSSLARITRVFPGSPGYGHAPMVWGLIGFVPAVGIVLYVLLRPKLVANSPEDIAGPGMSVADMEDQGKIVAPRLVSPGMLLIVPLAVVVGLFPPFRRQPSLELTCGRITGTGRFVKSDSVWFKQGEVGLRLRSVLPLERRGKLVYVVVEESADGTETTTQIAGAINTTGGVNRRSWGIPVEKAGTYRMEVKDQDGDVIASARFKIRRQ